ncbi:sterol desaturase family protein [Hyphococcus flavus]|uniref:Sterol desaturase family protein n=1 Tax=Hyphococcus flavus TaxID=1866326 RepID=A0AAF0CBR3_9PROT|nr:sterol desaturase family protein [Hyphococcus flavus]WDI31645.1 sterol desaturase family protein [Hyphococcus flavus]
MSNLGALFGVGSRFFLPYVLVAILIGVAATFYRRWKTDSAEKPNFLAEIFDPSVYFNRSSLVDLKVTIANRIFTPGLAVLSRSATVLTAIATVSMLSGEPPSLESDAARVSLAMLCLVTLAVTMASDFTTYLIHRLHHESDVLWPFHKLHHSAETLTPLTFTRKHPVYDLIRATANAFLVGPVQGIIFVAAGVTDIFLILGVNAAYAVFFWTGANLRHSHIWVSYGPILNRIFISPAQHQIHHSCAVQHHDKNYGEIFAFWDWIFGTLYVPENFEKLEFGVADATGKRLPQPHSTLKDAYLVPLVEAAAAVKPARKPKTAAIQ